VKTIFTKSTSRSILKGFLSGMALLLFIGCLFSSAFAADVKLSWNANSETDIAGYRIYKGLQSGTYTSNVFSSNPTTTATMTGLEEGKTYYFAATAINSASQESDYSNEVVYQVPVSVPVTFTITASSSGNGTISPSGTSTLDEGSSLTYAITAGTGYKVSDVVVDGASLGSRTSYTFSSVTANHTIQAIFAPVTWTITASSLGNGIISPSGSVSVNQGDNITFTMSPEIGYRVSDVVVDGVSQGDAETVTFSNVTANHAITVGFMVENNAPNADAGPDQKVEEGDEVTLSGQNSTDPDGDVLSYSWIQIEGPSIQLSNSETSTPVFQAPFVSFDGASLVFQLTVRDSDGLESKDTCIVNVTWVNDPPVADAGSNQDVYEGSLVALDASLSDDPDDGIASYWWTQTAGIQVTLSDPSSSRPYFTAPDVMVDGASLVFQLTVTDAGGLKSQDTCIVNVSWKNEPPVADAGTDQAACSGDAVTLNGGNSSDPDDGIASYRWTQLSGVPVVLSDPTAAAPVFTAPGVTAASVLEFQLTVTDRGGLQSSDGCIVTVNPTEEQYDTVEFSLNKGWNVITMIGTPVRADVAGALESIKGKYASVWLFEGGRWLTYYPTSTNNTLQTIENGKQYWIYMRTKAVLEIEIN
jgi:hypothetical protein